MSSWIHANGVIMMSTPWAWYDEDGDKAKERDLKYIEEEIFKDIPCGSEGSLEHEITYCAGYLNIILCGNLRDMYEKDLDYVEEWYKSIIQKLNDMYCMYVREHIFEVYVEYGEKRIISNVRSDCYEDLKKVQVIKVPFISREEEAEII